MKIVNLRMHQVRRLKCLELEPGIFNTEALMLVLKKKQVKGKVGSRMVFKYLDAQDDEKVMARKMYTINMLNGSSDYKNIKELIIPDYAVVVDGKVTGFAMPLIENHRNLGSIVNDENIDLDVKIPYLEQMGRIIDKVERVDNESFCMQFGDLNEYNFIIDQNDKVFAIDLDSAYLGQDIPVNSAYYLLKNKYIGEVRDKYKCNSSGLVIPSNNSDLYCYNMILLTALSNNSMFKENIETYYLYLNHLKDVGVDKELIKIFRQIYLPVPNENPRKLLKNIDTSVSKDMDYKVFKKEYKID